MSLFDTLFPKQTRSASRRPSARTRATNRRHRGEAFGEQLEQRLALAVVTPFAPRFTANVQGDITFAANTIMTAVAGLPGTPAQVADAQNGTNLTGDAPAIWNDDFWVMQFIDIDADATTFSSSSAVLDIPAGSEVLFAGLYWGGRVLGTTQFDAADNVKFRGPGDSGYQDLTATVFSSTTQGAPTTGARNYQGFKDVTSLVQARGEGTYTVANVQANEGKNYSAGWSLVVAYRDNTDLPRNLTVFDGFAYVTTADPDVTIPFSGFRAPLSGPVNATLGFVVYEGDLGITGDSAFFDGGLGESELSNATNPANNFFNSSISNRGVTVTAKTPNYKNQLGFDTDLVEADGLIANNATSATLRLTTTQDFYYPGVITSAIEVYAPKTVVTKSGQDLNAGLVEPGDVLRYTINVSNEASAYDTAKDVVLNDVIPAFTSYKLGSLVITSGANAGAKTDAIDTDQAEFIAGGNGAVRFRLGTGATGATVPTPSGGTLAAGQSTTVTFEVIVGEYPSSAVIENLASVSYSGTFFGPFTRTADFDFQCPPVIDLAITKSSPGSEYVPGEPATYSFTVANNGPAASPGSIVTDALPAQTTFNPALNPGWTLVGTTLTYATPALGSGGSTSFALTLLPASSRLGDLVNTATVAVPPGFFDRNLSNNTATETDTARPTVGLSVSKTDGSATYIPGDPVTYTIVVSNSGPSDLVGGSVVDLLPSVATSGAWTTSTAGGATVLPTTGGNNINATVNIPKSGSVTFTYTVQTKPIVIPIDPVTGPYPDLFNLVTVFLPQGTAGNTATATDNDTAAPQVDLAVTKTRTSPLPVIAGQLVTYSIVVTSNGPSSITTFSGTDVSVPGLLSPTYSVSTGTYDPNTGIWTANPGDTFDKGETVTFTFSGTVPAGATGTLTNTVSGTPPIFDPNPNNNTSTATDTIVVKPVLSVTKTDGSDTYIPGDPVTYTIVVSNSGPSDLVGGSVVDLLPSVATSGAWTTSTAGGATVLPTTGGNNINATVNIPKSGSVTFTYTVQTKPIVIPIDPVTGPYPDLFNLVTVFLPQGTAGNTATATDNDTAAPQVDLAVTKTRTSPLPVIAGEIVTYSIVVTSNGPSSITTFSGTDVTVPGLLSPTYSVSTGTYDPNTGIWTADPGDTFDDGESVTFTFSGTVPANATGTLTNTASGTPPIFDPNPDNNTSTATDTIVVKPVLSITKTDNATIYVPGTTTTYTIVATNAGPSFLAGGTVSDPLPAQVSSATWTAVYSAGSSGPESGSGPLNETVDLAPGGTATFTFTVQIKPDATGDLVNTVTITPPPNTQGNTATATDTNTISNPQLLLNVTKTDGKTTYLPNETFTYTIVVSNSGPSTMVDGVVNDPLPSQVATGSWTASYSAGSSGPASGSGGITNEKITLLPGGNATFLLTVTIRSDAFGQMDNTVTLTPPAGIVVTPGSVLSATDTNFGPEPPASIGGALVVGSDDGCNGPPWVRVLDPNSGVELSRFLAYDARFRGSVRVAVGDVTGDGVAEIITAPSRNLVGEVRVFQRNLFGAAQQNGLSEWSELTQYRTLAFGPRYRGGVEVAVADIDGDRVNDIVTAMSIQSGMVNVFKVTLNGGDPVANTPFKSFRGAPVGTNNGVMISAGDYINGGILGGPAEIAVGTNSGTRALVRIFDVSGTPKVVRSFNPFANGFRGGVTLSTADYDGNGSLDLIVGAGLNGGSRVEVWNPATTSRIAQTSVFSSLAKPNARVFAVFGSAADGFLGPDSTLYGVQGLNGGRGSKGVWKVLSGKAESLVNSQTSLPPLRIAPIGLPLAPIAPRLG